MFYFSTFVRLKTKHHPKINTRVSCLQYWPVENMAALRSLPKTKTLEKWKNKHEWLTISDGSMFCAICTKVKERLELMPGYSDSFIKGSKNFKTSALSDHEESKTHKQAIKCKLHNEAVSHGEVYKPPRVVNKIPGTAPIALGVKRMREAESKGLVKLFEVAYLVAIKGRPYSDFKDLITL